MTADIERPSWDATWMAVAGTIARRSRCVRAQVGCVLVSADQAYVSTGYNGPPAGYAVSGPCSGWCPRAQSHAPGTAAPVGYDACPSTHAESNALVRADFSRIKGGTAYVTGAMCWQCAPQIANSGLDRVVHIVRDSDAHRLPERSEALLTASGLEVVRWSL